LPRSTSTTSGRRSQSLRQCKPNATTAPGVTPLHEDSRGSFWIVCGTSWIRHPALAIGRASWTLTLSSILLPAHSWERPFLTAFSPETPPLSCACYPINLVCSCGSRWKRDKIPWFHAWIFFEFIGQFLLSRVPGAPFKQQLTVQRN
jgi:hypothetical protein